MLPTLPVGASLLATALAAMAGCSGLPTASTAPSASTATAASTATIAAPAASGTFLSLHDGESRIELRLDRAGPLASLGHRHVIVTRAVRGTAHFDFAHPETAQFSAAFGVETLQVDEPAERAAAGDAFAKLPDATAISGTRTNMLSTAVLHAARFPDIRFQLQQLVPGSVTVRDSGAANAPDRRSLKGVASVRFTLKGVERTLPVPVQITALPNGSIVASGQWTATHEQLGLQPFSAAGGLVRVADAMEIHFRLVARPA